MLGNHRPRTQQSNLMTIRTSSNYGVSLVGLDWEVKPGEGSRLAPVSYRKLEARILKNASQNLDHILQIDQSNMVLSIQTVLRDLCDSGYMRRTEGCEYQMTDQGLDYFSILQVMNS